MARKVLIQIRRGPEASIGVLATGEMGFCTDTKKLYIGTDTGNELLVAAQTVGDMLKSIYDTDNDGKVDVAENADTVDGKHAGDLYVLTLAEPLANGDDLNNFTVPGCWYSSDSVQSATLLNCPQITAGGKLVVEHIAVATIRHKWTVNSTYGAPVYERHRSRDNVWGAWVKTANQEDIDKQVSKSGDTMTGKLTLPASTAARASLNILAGVNPTSPVEGDMWFDADKVLRFRRNNGTATFWDTGNLAAVSQAEAEAGTNTAVRVWTAQRVAQAVAAQAMPKGPITWNQLKGV